MRILGWSEMPTLPYATVDTQCGVIIDQLPDGGVVVTVPGSSGRFLGRRLGRSTHPLEALITVIVYGFSRLVLRRPPPPIAVIELSSAGLTIMQPWEELQQRRSWPLHEVGEVRANRYSNGVYVRIPGKDSFDLLGDLDEQLVQHIGNTLSDALERVSHGSNRPA